MAALHTGEKLIIAGLFVQLFAFAFFIVVASIFHYRLVTDKPLRRIGGASILKSRKHRHLASTSSAAPFNATTVPRSSLNQLPWKRHLYNLYFTSGLIMFRSIFRVVEYIQGNAGYLLSHEVFLYIFDAVLMLAVMIMFNWVHPSEVTENTKSENSMRMEDV